MNDMYSNFKDRIWYNNVKGGVPNSRWLVNFDYDLLDCLVLAACHGAYCPFLISTRLIDLYTKPETLSR
ncbi:CHDC2 [Bugula neritina]|uniref:CHDC2 n=1 Tax=Bugula neritina TaxID=10212 RepID=A0A7J7JR24_BUGNE|nr:CHDC2 [Bugula neritina]